MNKNNIDCLILINEIEVRVAALAAILPFLRWNAENDKLGFFDKVDYKYTIEILDRALKDLRPSSLPDIVGLYKSRKLNNA